LAFAHNGKLEDAESERVYQSALKELADELLPIRAHGLNEIKKLVLARNPVATKNLGAILCIFLDMLQDEDRFVYPFYVFSAQMNANLVCEANE
jgi:hypothetical protein